MTKVGINRLKDFSIYEGRIGTIIESYSNTPPAGCLYLGNRNTQVSKTDWSELYNIIGGEDGTTSGTFVLPYKADENNIKSYIVGKVLLSEITTSGNVVVSNITQNDLDSNGYYTFHHGIGHIHPIIQLYDNNGNQVGIAKLTNSVGQSKLQVTSSFNPTITGVWTIQAIG